MNALFFGSLILLFAASALQMIGSVFKKEKLSEIAWIVFLTAFAALSVEGGQKASSDMEGQEAFSSMEGCFLCETELKGNDALVKELAGLADVSADVSIQVRLWVLERATRSLPRPLPGAGLTEPGLR